MREAGVPRYFAGAVSAAEEFPQAAALVSGSAVTHLALQLVVMNHSDPAAMLADPIFRNLNLGLRRCILWLGYRRVRHKRQTIV